LITDWRSYRFSIKWICQRDARGGKGPDRGSGRMQAEEIIEVSAKTGMGIDLILERIIQNIPPPKGDPDAPLQALIFDSVFNSFRGIFAYFKIHERNDP